MSTLSDMDRTIGGYTKQVNLQMPVQLKACLQVIAAEDKRTMAEIMRIALWRFVNERVEEDEKV